MCWCCKAGRFQWFRVGFGEVRSFGRECRKTGPIIAGNGVDACKVRRRSLHYRVERGIRAIVLWRRKFSCTPAHALDDAVQGPQLELTYQKVFMIWSSLPSRRLVTLATLFSSRVPYKKDRMVRRCVEGPSG